MQQTQAAASQAPARDTRVAAASVCCITCCCMTNANERASASCDPRQRARQHCVCVRLADTAHQQLHQRRAPRALPRITRHAPASAMIMLGPPWRCSSRTHALARLNESVLVMSYTMMAAAAPLRSVSCVQQAGPAAERPKQTGHMRVSARACVLAGACAARPTAACWEGACAHCHKGPSTQQSTQRC